MHKLNKAYRIAAIYPSIFVIVACFIYSVIENKNYKSEWLTGESIIFLSMLITFVFSILMCLFCLTIFLNIKEKIKTNIFLNFLSWFLLPISVIVFIIIHDVLYRLKYHENFGSDFIFILILTVPFIVGLVWSFIYYKRKETIE
jgi:hypothetical protein